MQNKHGAGNIATSMTKNKNTFYKSGFTIVELLVVIVVIGILATVGFIQYVGMQDRAREAVLRSDLTSAAEILNIDQVRTGSYPEEMDQADRGSGLPASAGTEYQYRADNSVEPPIFCLTGINGPVALFITQDGVINEGTCEGDHGPIAGGSDDGGGSDGGDDGGARVVTGIDVDGDVTCAIVDEKAYCWGRGDYHLLGNASSQDRSSPYPVDTSNVLAGKTVTDITVPAANNVSACAVASGMAYCWGNHSKNFTLGSDFNDPSPLPIAVDASGALAGKTVEAVSGQCALASGSVYCWGHNNYYQLGRPGGTSPTPVAVDTSGVLSGKTVTEISSGQIGVCVVASGGAYCWGNGSHGRLGHGSTSSSNVPVAVNTSGALAGKTVTSISRSLNTVCAVADSQVYCWGLNQNSLLFGETSITSSNVPVAIDTSGVFAGKDVTDVSVGGDHICAIADGQAYCWGQGASGQLGRGSTTSSNVPVAVDTSGVLAGKTVTDISAGMGHSCAIADGQAYCWGRNNYGQVGDGSTADRLVPVAVDVSAWD